MSRRRVPLPGLGRRPLAVATLQDYAHLLTDARNATRMGAALLEIRADCFPRDVLRLEPLRALLAGVRITTRRPLLLTLRSRAEGGKLPAGFREQDRLGLFRAGLSEATLVDVEMNADDINRHVVFEAKKRRRFAILSHHNFKTLPSNARLSALVRKAQRLKGNILKVAGRSPSRKETERFMAFCRKAPFPYRVFVAMGPHGRLTRFQGFDWDSCLSYGHVRRPAVPGQPSVRDLLQAWKD